MSAERYTLEAAADLSAKQYHLVRYVATQKCNLASEAANSGLVGVLQNKPKSGEGATIFDGGISKVVAGGAITAGVILTTNGSGRVAAVTSGQMAMGRALTAAGADGEIIEAKLFPPIKWFSAP